MDRGLARAILVIPSGMSRDLEAGRNVSVQVLLDGDNANTATTVMGYALTILQSESAKYSLAPAGGGSLVSALPRVWYNPQLRSALFLVPGLIAYIAMITSVVSTALSIVREKERGTMEQVRMAPLGAASFVIGKTLPYYVISLISSFAILLVAMLLFGLPMRGSWIVLLAATSLYLVAALGLGLFVSSLAETQQVAFQVAVLASFLPTLMLSGFIFPISSMPPFLQAVTNHRSCKVLPDCAAWHRTQRRRVRSDLAAARRAGCLLGDGASVGVAAPRGGSGGDVMRRIRFLIWKELIELGQDPRLFGIVILAPIIQLFLLAYAATTDMRNVPIVVADADRSTQSRELVTRFNASPIFTIAGVVNSPDDVDEYLEQGKAWIALVIPPGYGEVLTGGRSQAVQIVADGSDANSAGVALVICHQPDRELRPGNAAPAAATAGSGTVSAAAFSRLSASGSIRDSKAATS